MQELYRELHVLTQKIMRRREIELRFLPPVIELEDTRYIVIDLQGLLERLRAITNDPQLSDSFNECYDLVLEAIRPCVAMPQASEESQESIRKKIFAISDQPLYRPIITQTNISWQMVCGISTCHWATLPSDSTVGAEEWARENGWRKIVDGTWVCPEHARLIGDHPRIGGLHCFWLSNGEWFDIRCGANWETKDCHFAANAAQSIDGAIREAKQAGWKKIDNGPWCCPAHWDALLKAGIRCEVET